MPLLIMIVMRYFRGIFSMGVFITAAYSSGFGNEAFSRPCTFADNRIFHPLHVFSVLTIVAPDHFDLDCHNYCI